MTVATFGAQVANQALSQVVATASKPHAIDALRKTWRRSAEHFAEQVTRFVRLLVVSAIPVVVSAVSAATFSGSKFDPKTLLALLVPVFEVAYRQVFPALGAAAADAAPGVTIVPSQVGVPDNVNPVVPDAAPAPVVDPGPALVVTPVTPGVDTTPTGDGPPVTVPFTAPPQSATDPVEPAPAPVPVLAPAPVPAPVPAPADPTVAADAAPPVAGS